MRKSRHLAAALAIFMILAPAFTTAALANSLTATSPTAGSVLSVAPNAILNIGFSLILCTFGSRKFNSCK